MLTTDVNNFKKVLSIIQHNCGESSTFAHADCFKTVAASAEIPEEEIATYLSLLQDFGIVKYSMEDKVIELTPFGKKLDVEIKD